MKADFLKNPVMKPNCADPCKFLLTIYSVSVHLQSSDFTVRVTECQHRSTMKVVESSSLGILKNYLTRVLDSQLSVVVLGVEKMTFRDIFQPQPCCGSVSVQQTLHLFHSSENKRRKKDRKEEIECYFMIHFFPDVCKYL